MLLLLCVNREARSQKFDLIGDQTKLTFNAMSESLSCTFDDLSN